MTRDEWAAVLGAAVLAIGILAGLVLGAELKHVLLPVLLAACGLMAGRRKP